MCSSLDGSHGRAAGRHLRPRHRRLARRQPLRAQIGQTRSPPQRQRHRHVTEPARAFDPHALQAHRHPQIPPAVVEQTCLLRRADQMAGQRPRLQPAPLAKLRHRLRNDTTANAHAAHKTPIAMDFAVLPPRRVAQVHAPITTQRLSKENGQGRHYTPIPTAPARQPFDRAQPLPTKKQNPPSFCASWAGTTPCSCLR
jgi:hypothetical protein